MVPDNARSQTARLAAWLDPFLPPVLVCAAVLCLPLAPQLRFDTDPVPRPGVSRTRGLQTVSAPTAAELQRLLDRIWVAAAGNVPAVAPARLPGDLDQLPVAARKQVFFRSLLPHVLDQNRRIQEDRAQLQALRITSDDGGLAEQQTAFLGTLAARYRLETEGVRPQQRVQALLGRVDVVPPSIALAQAAIESAWGTSRFTRLGNNLFGQWVFDRDRGIAPLERPDDANYSLAKFPGLGDAVDAYLRNLNGFYAYDEFRQLRREMRAAGKPLDPMLLAAGLRSYSTRREAYVREILAVIRDNDLVRYDHARLSLPQVPIDTP